MLSNIEEKNWHFNQLLTLFYLFSARYTGIFVASFFQHFIFVLWWMVFAVAQHPTHCIPCIQVRDNAIFIHLLRHNFIISMHILDTKIVRSCLDQACTIQPASWMPTHWPNANEKDGLNWPFTYCHSSITYTGKYDSWLDINRNVKIHYIHFVSNH